MKAAQWLERALEELDGAKEYVALAYAEKNSAPKLREMARQELQHGQNLFEMSRDAEYEDDDGTDDLVAKYAQCRATVKMMIDSM